MVTVLVTIMFTSSSSSSSSSSSRMFVSLNTLIISSIDVRTRPRRGTTASRRSTSTSAWTGGWTIVLYSMPCNASRGVCTSEKKLFCNSPNFSKRKLGFDDFY